MNQKEKKKKKAMIGEFIDLANGRFKDDEIDTLSNLVKNRDEYNGMSKTYYNSFDSWSSEGKYTRNEETTYTFSNDDSGISIKEHYQYRDDDGQSDSYDQEYNTGREILRHIDKIFTDD